MPRVCVAMSGGVDSTVAALLLSKQGYQVFGVSLRLFERQDSAPSSFGSCCSLEDIHLVLVGDWAGDVFYTCYEELCTLVERHGLGGAVHFTGFVPDEDLVHLYTACQAFVLPSFLEGFGLPAVEAMACGAAVVASNVGSLPEVLDGAGELFDPHDTAALVGYLKRILQDSVYQRELQTRSLQRALDFSWETSARQMRNIFDTMKA